MASPRTKTANKLGDDLAHVLPHLQLDEQGRPALAGCNNAVEALARLEQAGLLVEATRLIAHALPAREAVWWACACSRHTAAPGPPLAGAGEGDPESAAEGKSGEEGGGR